jgi:integrase
MLYLAMRISMESGIRIGSLRQIRWSHISENKTLSNEDRKIWCIVEVPAENTKTGRWYELSAPIMVHLERLKKITHPKHKSDPLFLNQSTGKPFSSRIWRDGLIEMLVEAGLATLAPDDCNNQRKSVVKSGKILTWYSFRHTWITFALERGVPIATVCNNCDTSIEYIQDHYFHYDAKRATGALATGRKGLRAGLGSG